MRPVRQINAWEPCLTAPETREEDTENAHLTLQSAARGLSFWDHLGATRAEEYAREEILPGMVPPAQPVSPIPSQNTRLSMGDMSAVHGFSLTQSLNTPEAAPDTGSALPSRDPARDGRSSVQVRLLHDVSQHDGADVIMSDLRVGGERVAKQRLGRGTGRLAYRLQRIWLTPGYRLAFKYGVPIVTLLLSVALFLADEGRRAMIVSQYDAVRDAIIDRPEFAVTELSLPEMSPELDYTLRQQLNIDLPQSSFRLDLDALRAEVEQLDWVRSADLRLLSGGTLALSVTERVPAILWRSGDTLELLDTEGVRVAYVAQRSLRADLPLIAGAGANAHVSEALEILDAAAPLGPRVLGLIRMGERRWDVALDRGQRIRLPEVGAVAALERVIALDQAQDLLARDVLVADLRNPARPVLQISPGALETLQDIRSQSMEASQ
ncbi:MAG: cell division protein FtsQ/DivIB [Roseinatronobacter sp.]